jgi:hypothetical protein
MAGNQGFEGWAKAEDDAALAEIEQAFFFLMRGSVGLESLRKLGRLAELNGEDWEQFWRRARVKRRDGSWAIDVIAQNMLRLLKARYLRGKTLVVGEHRWPANPQKAKANPEPDWS